MQGTFWLRAVVIILIFFSIETEHFITFAEEIHVISFLSCNKTPSQSLINIKPLKLILCFCSVFYMQMPSILLIIFPHGASNSLNSPSQDNTISEGQCCDKFTVWELVSFQAIVFKQTVNFCMLESQSWSFFWEMAESATTEPLSDSKCFSASVVNFFFFFFKEGWQPELFSRIWKRATNRNYWTIALWNLR